MDSNKLRKNNKNINIQVNCEKTSKSLVQSFFNMDGVVPGKSQSAGQRGTISADPSRGAKRTDSTGSVKSVVSAVTSRSRKSLFNMNMKSSTRKVGWAGHEPYDWLPARIAQGTDTLLIGSDANLLKEVHDLAVAAGCRLIVIQTIPLKYAYRAEKLHLQHHQRANLHFGTKVYTCSSVSIEDPRKGKFDDSSTPVHDGLHCNVQFADSTSNEFVVFEDMAVRENIWWVWNGHFTLVFTFVTRSWGSPRVHEDLVTNVKTQVKWPVLTLALF